MNKKQEALRRGLRSFIEDTSRELADLEGRPLGPPPDPRAVDGDTVAVSAAAPGGGGAERAAPDGAPAEVHRADSPRHESQAGAAAAPESAPPPARTMAEPGPLATGHPPKTGHAPAASALKTKEPVTEPPGARRDAPPVVRHEVPPTAPLNVPPAGRPESQPVKAPEPPARRDSEVPDAPSHAEKPTRRAQAPVRRRPRTGAEIGANGVSPAQAHARKGVCFAYFVNHECWRVTDAYCNSALQVCITRECPIYHLHKDALERRFARKFKHFW